MVWVCVGVGEGWCVSVCVEGYGGCGVYGGVCREGHAGCRVCGCGVCGGDLAGMGYDRRLGWCERCRGCWGL